ncbi:HgcAB-associated protein HgcC [Acidobacteriota bacterium]
MKDNPKNSCAPTLSSDQSCCRVEAITSMDERGQMVLPKEVREKAGIKAGDKLAVITWEKDGQICCLSLIKADNFSGMIKDILGPMLEEIK